MILFSGIQDSSDVLAVSWQQGGIPLPRITRQAAGWPFPYVALTKSNSRKSDFWRAGLYCPGYDSLVSTASLTTSCVLLHQQGHRSHDQKRGISNEPLHRAGPSPVQASQHSCRGDQGRSCIHQAALLSRGCPRFPPAHLRARPGVQPDRSSASVAWRQDLPPPM